jgi:hypothetical protein
MSYQKKGPREGRPGITAAEVQCPRRRAPHEGDHEAAPENCPEVRRRCESREQTKRERDAGKEARKKEKKTLLIGALRAQRGGGNQKWMWFGTERTHGTELELAKSTRAPGKGQRNTTDNPQCE